MQNKVKEFNNKLTPLSPSIRALDISSEVGELMKEVIKAQSYGTKTFSVNESLQLEVGDVLYSVLSFCNENNIDAEYCLDKVIEKYNKRLLLKKDIGSGN